MKALFAVLLAALAALFPLLAAAAPVKCVDAKGKVLYIDEANAGALKCEPVTGSTVIVPRDQPTRVPTIKPDNSLEEKRQRVAAAEAKLADAQKALADQEAVREGNEKNYARVLERLKPYQETVAMHEKNIASLRQEMTNLK
jgi:hypothetical protein